MTDLRNNGVNPLITPEVARHWLVVTGRMAEADSLLMPIPDNPLDSLGKAAVIIAAGRAPLDLYELYDLATHGKPAYPAPIIAQLGHDMIANYERSVVVVGDEGFEPPTPSV